MFNFFAFSLFMLVCLFSLASTLALPPGNVLSSLSYPTLNGTLPFNDNEGRYYPIPHTPLTIHFTLIPPATPLPAQDTLVCLHKFALLLSSEPPLRYLDRARNQTANQIEATIAPVHCPICGLTYRDSCKVLAGLWYYASRAPFLYAQRFGVFEGRTGRMVAWGTLLAAPRAPGTAGGGMDGILNLPSGLAETS